MPSTSRWEVSHSVPARSCNRPRELRRQSGRLTSRLCFSRSEVAASMLQKSWSINHWRSTLQLAAYGPPWSNLSMPELAQKTTSTRHSEHSTMRSARSPSLARSGAKEPVFAWRTTPWIVYAISLMQRDTWTLQSNLLHNMEIPS